MKGNLTGPARAAAVTSAMMLGALITLAGCVAESMDGDGDGDEGAATPINTVLGFQPDVPKIPASAQKPEPSKSGGAQSTKPPQTSTPSDDHPSADPEPSPWVPPGYLPPAH